MSERIRVTSKTEEELAREALNERLTVFLEYAVDMDFRLSGLEHGDFDKHLFACALTEMLHDIVKEEFFGDWVGSTGIKLRDGNNTWLEQAAKDKIQSGEWIPEALKKPEGAQNAHSPTGQILLSIMRMMNEPREGDINEEILKKCQIIQQEKDLDRRLDLAAEFFYQETQNMLSLAIGEYLKRKDLIELMKEKGAEGFNKWRKNRDVDLLGASLTFMVEDEYGWYDMSSADLRFTEISELCLRDGDSMLLDGAYSAKKYAYAEIRVIKQGAITADRYSIQGVSCRSIKGQWMVHADINGADFSCADCDEVILYWPTRYAKFNDAKISYLQVTCRIGNSSFKRSRISEICIRPPDESIMANLPVGLDDLDLRDARISEVVIEQGELEGALLTQRISRIAVSTETFLPQNMRDSIETIIELEEGDPLPFSVEPPADTQSKTE